jgi:hypothetical protein
MDPRKLQVGDRILVDPHAYVGWGFSIQSDTPEPAVIAGIGRRKGLKGIQTPIYVKLESNGEQISVPAGAVAKSDAPK